MHVTWPDFLGRSFPQGRTDEEIATLTVLRALRDFDATKFMEFTVLFSKFGIAGIQDAMAHAAQSDVSLDWATLLRIADWELVERLLQAGAASFREHLCAFKDEALMDEAYPEGYPLATKPGVLFRVFVSRSAN